MPPRPDEFVLYLGLFRSDIWDSDVESLSSRFIALSWASSVLTLPLRPQSHQGLQRRS